MRLWTIHPKYLDPSGLVALWREALLARAVLDGKTRGYRHHPQLERFKSHPKPQLAISAYLMAVHSESVARGYSFDASKIGSVSVVAQIAASTGQVAYEWQHLLHKLSSRSPAVYDRWHTLSKQECHPMFYLQNGQIESWEHGAMLPNKSFKPKPLRGSA